jgi:ribose/xylose/arabinose/galactoside ABC-type transport system permease subunit
MSCPICNALNKKRMGKGKLCRDCGGNPELRNEFSLYEMWRGCVWSYYLVVPAICMMGLIHGFLMMDSGLSSCVHALIHLSIMVGMLCWTRTRYGLSSMRKRMDESYYKMFVLKVSGACGSIG